MTEELEFNSMQGQETFLYSVVSRLALRPTGHGGL
jgi:hypothetical protein